MWQSAHAGLTRSKPARLPWAEAGPLIGLLSALCWALIVAIALTIWSAF